MKVQVWNDNTHKYKETFKGDLIEIPAGGFIHMEEDDAHQFKGTFSPPVLDYDGNHTPAGYKMIRIVKSDQAAPEPKAEVDPLKCIVCGYKASSKADLAEHMKTHEHNKVEDPELDKEIAAKKARTKKSA